MTRVATTMDLQKEFFLLCENVQEMRQENAKLMSMVKYNTIIEAIRKWDLRFTGDGDDQNLHALLKKVEENCKLLNLSCDDLVPHLSMFFKGTASIWYETYHKEWKTWEDFREAAELWYPCFKDVVCRKPLVKKLEDRVQGLDELARDYMIHATALISKQEPDPAKGKDYQLDVMFRNLRPEIKEIINRDQFDSVEKLLLLAMAAEQFIEYEKRQRSQPDCPCHIIQEDEAKPKIDSNAKTEPKSISKKQGSSTPKTSKQTSKQTRKQTCKQESKEDSTLINDYANAELDILYEYMTPYIKKRVRRDQIDSMDTLIAILLIAEAYEIGEFPDGIIRTIHENHLKVGSPTAKDSPAFLTVKDQVDLLYKYLAHPIKERMRRDKIESTVLLVVMIMRTVAEMSLEKSFEQKLHLKKDAATELEEINSANSKQENSASRRVSNGRPQ